jgi:hypothetical protein
MDPIVGMRMDKALLKGLLQKLLDMLRDPIGDAVVENRSSRHGSHQLLDLLLLEPPILDRKAVSVLRNLVHYVLHTAGFHEDSELGGIQSQEMEEVRVRVLGGDRYYRVENHVYQGECPLQ